MTIQDLTTENGMLAYLRSSPYPGCNNVSSVKRLPEGYTGFVYRAFFDSFGEEPPATGSIIVKHAAGFASRAPGWKLDPDRIAYEYKATSYLQRPCFQLDQLVRTPGLIYYDEVNNVLLMEDVGNLPSLKGWMQSGVSPETTTEIGEALGRFLANVHNATGGVDEVLSIFDGNATGKYLSGTLYFGALPKAAEKFGYVDGCIREAAKVGEREVYESREVLTLGDFWTGNILVSATETQGVRLYVLDLELAKPGTAAFDVGQMAAEMYFLATYRDDVLGKRLLKSFLTSYKECRREKVNAAKVAIRIAAHIFAIMPAGWRSEVTQTQMQEVAQIGRDLMQMGWEKDEAGLRESIVGDLI